MNQIELDNFSITNKSDLDKLSDNYEGNLLNYFYGFTPEESRKFNKLKRQNTQTYCYKPYRTLQNY